MPQVVFEPIGEEITCGEDETVLDAAFREGYSFVHGCREGQCSACKCYLLEGEVSLKPYSTFALSESEEAQGYTLMCRALPDEDLVVELLHFDPDDYRLDVPIRDGRARVTAVSDLTSDISHVHLEVLEPDDFDYRPGAYVDLHVPGREEERRSFSLAGLPTDDGLELMVKRYPGGVLSGLIDDGTIVAGSEIGFTGPYGSFHLRDSDRPVLMVAGGSGMAPQVALLRELVRLQSTRTVRFFYGARTADDLFHREIVADLGAQLADFRFVEVLSDAEWEGETGFVHEAVDRFLRDEGFGSDEPEAYLCGPPPMVDAAIELLRDAHDVEAADMHFDKFTTTTPQESP